MRLRDDDVTWREIDGEMVILDLQSSAYLTANAAGTLLLKRLVEPTTAPALAQVLVEAFDVPASVAARDVAAFLDLLDQRGLLDREDEQHSRHPSHAATGDRS
ncbi:PqqD family protein [Nocardioides sp. YIM 152588]|uniref:PqqD family protein n=1 Tax=Nocardioides sp. YIM 152588 TaxID=3158259 RepID=UPI0032E4E3DD